MPVTPTSRNLTPGPHRHPHTCGRHTHAHTDKIFFKMLKNLIKNEAYKSPRIFKGKLYGVFDYPVPFMVCFLLLLLT